MEGSEGNMWILWAIAAPLGPLLGWLLRKFWSSLDRLLRYFALAFFAVSIAVALCTIFTPWSLRGIWPQAVNLALAYISAACLCGVAFTKSKRSLSLFAIRGFAVVILLFVYYGLLFAYWRTDPVESETVLGDNLVVRRCSGGWASIYWEGVTIVQQPSRLVERTLYRVHIGDTGDCDETSVRVNADPLSREIRVQCGRQNPYTFARIKMP
jgi:hypothetical protein